MGQAAPPRRLEAGGSCPADVFPFPAPCLPAQSHLAVEFRPRASWLASAAWRRSSACTGPVGPTGPGRRFAWFALTFATLLTTHLVYLPSASLFLAVVFFLVLFGKIDGGWDTTRPGWPSVCSWPAPWPFMPGSSCWGHGYETEMQQGYAVAIARDVWTMLASTLTLLEHGLSVWCITKPPLFWIGYLLVMGLSWWRGDGAAPPVQPAAAGTAGPGRRHTILPNIATQTKWNIHYRSTAALQMELAALLLFVLDVPRLMAHQPAGRTPARPRPGRRDGGVSPFSARGRPSATNKPSTGSWPQAVETAAASGNADLCPESVFLRYDQHGAETLVDDTLLPIDFSYPRLLHPCGRAKPPQGRGGRGGPAPAFSLRPRQPPPRTGHATGLREPRRLGSAPARPATDPAAMTTTPWSAVAIRGGWPRASLTARGQFLQGAGNAGQ